MDKMIQITIGVNNFGDVCPVLAIHSDPNYSVNGDFHYVADFLEIDKNTEYGYEDMVIKMLQYWKDRIGSIQEDQEKFIPFGMWDEYVDGLMIKKVGDTFEIRNVSTTDIQGYGINKSVMDQAISDKVVFKKSEKSWTVSGEDLYKDLDENIEMMEEVKKEGPFEYINH